MIAKFNDFIVSSIKAYEDGRLLDNELQALALYNIVVIQPGENKYGAEADDWERFQDFAKEDLANSTVILNDVEKEAISNNIKLSFKQLAEMEEKLIASNSDKADQILRIAQNIPRIGNQVSNVKEGGCFDY